MSFEVYQDDDGSWRWRFLDGSGTVVAVGSRGEYSEEQAKRAVLDFKRQVEAAPLPEREPDDMEQ